MQLSSFEETAGTPALEIVQHLAHQVRQPLSAMETIAYYLEMNLAQHGPVFQHASRLREMVEQASWMLSDVLQHLTQAPLQKSEVCLNELVTEAASMLSLPRRATVTVETDEALPAVQGDVTQLQHLLQTLIQVSARLSHGQGPTRLLLRQESGFAVLEMQTADRFDATAPVATLFVAYSGHPAFHGGLGLLNVRRIAEAHGGDCEALRPQEGSLTVRVRLPLSS